MEAEAVPEISEKLEVAMVPTFVLMKVTATFGFGAKSCGSPGTFRNTPQVTGGKVTSLLFLTRAITLQGLIDFKLYECREFWCPAVTSILSHALPSRRHLGLICYQFILRCFWYWGQMCLELCKHLD